MNKLFLILICSFCISCNPYRVLECPIKNSKIIFIERKGAEMLKPSSTVKIVGENKEVYSSMKGVINLIDTVSSKLEISIITKNYIIVYQNLATTILRKGDNIKKGQYLGRVLDNDSLEVSVIKNGVPYMPDKVFKCPMEYVHEQ